MKGKGMGKDMEKGKGKDKGQGKDKGGGEARQPNNQATPLGDFMGVIKSFNPNNGYGFIDCPDLKAIYFHDVFLHHQQLGEFSVGDTVQFTAYLDNSGKPQGKDLKFPIPDGGSMKRQ